MKPLAAAWIVLVVGTLSLPGAVRGASVTAHATRDNTLYAEFDTLSNGAGQRVFAGRNGTGSTRRGLIRFDLTGLVPSGATVDSVVLELTLAQTGPESRLVSLHRVLADWGEGTSAGSMGEGGGAPATPGDATWGQRFFGAAQPWTTPGGDFDAIASAGRPVGAAGVYAWRSAGMTADVIFWRQNPASNFGWELVGDEAVTGSAKAFGSREAGVAASRPLLTIYYTEAPTGTAPLPAPTRLFSVHPNPFNPSATIRYHLARTTHVRLCVYDVWGRMIRVLMEGVLAPGDHEAVWRGDDARGLRVASGVYLARLETPDSAPQTEKMVLLK